MSAWLSEATRQGEETQGETKTHFASEDRSGECDCTTWPFEKNEEPDSKFKTGLSHIPENTA